MNRISDISYEKSLIDRMFGCGTLVVSDASELGRVELRDIPRVEQAQLTVSDELLPPNRPSTAPDPMTAPEDLERAIVGAVPELTGEQVADAAGLTVEAGRSGCGGPWASPRSAARSRSATADAEALVSVAAIVKDGGLDFDTIVRMTRAVGQTMDRLAEWEVATLAAQLDRSGPEASKTARGAAAGGDDRPQLRGAADLRMAAPPGRRGHAGGEPGRRRGRADRRGDGRVRRPGQLQRAHQPARRGRDRRPGRGLRGPQPRRGGPARRAGS